MNQLDLDDQRVAALCRKWHVAELALFGSVLRSDFQPESDVDVLVDLSADAELDLFDWIAMKEELEHMFGRSVDLVDKSGIRNPYRREAILSSCETVYVA